MHNISGNEIILMEFVENNLFPKNDNQFDGKSMKNYLKIGLQCSKVRNIHETYSSVALCVDVGLNSGEFLSKVKSEQNKYLYFQFNLSMIFPKPSDRFS